MKFSFELMPHLAQDVPMGIANLIVTLENGEKYFGTLFTFDEICKMSSRTDNSYLWSSHMVIVKEYSKVAVEAVLQKMIKNDEFFAAFLPFNQQAQEKSVILLN